MAIDANLANGIPTGSAAVGGNPAWLVGRSESLASVARWDGTAWRRVAAPWTTDAGLTAVSALSSSAAWTVGFRRLIVPRSISARWNGTSWVADEVPHPGGNMATLTDVVALGAKKAFAVGLRLTAGRLEPLALQRLKTGWVNRSPVFGPGTEGGLTAVSRTSDGKIWAAGWRSDGDGPAPWIGVLYQSAWYSIPVADPGPGLGFLTDIELISPAEGWAVGYLERADGGYAPILQHWDGQAWLSESLPWDAAASVVLTTVAVDSDSVLVVAGQQMTDAGGSAVFATRELGEWRLSAARSDPYPGSWTQSATGLGPGAFVVGHFGASTRAYIACESGAPDGPPPTTGRPTGQPEANAFHEDLAAGPAAGSGSESGAFVPAGVLPGFVARDMTEAAGLQMRAMTYSGVVADFNGDTWPDVFINRHGSDVPFYALGGETGFTPASASFQFTDRHLCAAADATGDDEIDLFCTVGRRQGTAMGANEFLVNVGETGGTLAGEQFGLLDITGRGRAAAFVQLASDQLPSLFMTSEPIRIDGLPSFNRFYRNLDGTRFVPAPELGLDSSSGGVCTVAANLDADADDELLVCTSEAAGGLSAGARLYDFDGTRFVDQTRQLGIAPFASMDIEVADFDGDGSPDIAQLRGSRLRVSLASASGFVNVFELETKKAVAMAVGDVNEDGRPDIYVCREALGNGAHLMLVNRGDGESFSNVEIPQPGSGNADDVLALDYDQNGLTDFLTFNGRFGPGPIKLTAFFPTDE